MREAVCEGFLGAARLLDRVRGLCSRCGVQRLIEAATGMIHTRRGFCGCRPVGFGGNTGLLHCAVIHVIQM